VIGVGWRQTAVDLGLVVGAEAFAEVSSLEGPKLRPIFK